MRGKRFFGINLSRCNRKAPAAHGARARYIVRRVAYHPSGSDIESACKALARPLNGNTPQRISTRVFIAKNTELKKIKALRKEAAIPPLSRLDTVKSYLPAKWLPSWLKTPTVPVPKLF